MAGEKRSPTVDEDTVNAENDALLAIMGMATADGGGA